MTNLPKDWNSTLDNIYTSQPNNKTTLKDRWSDFKKSDIFPIIIVAVVMTIGMCLTYDYPQY